MDISPQMQERVVCSISAAAKYDTPANVLLPVADRENGRPVQCVRSANGSHDVRPLHFNIHYLKGLARDGIAPADVAATGCYSDNLAAWRLRQHILKDGGDIWTRCAN